MTIKTKLIVNILVTATIIIAISLACFSSMHFLQDKLAYIAEKSTPFQMATVEFQGELQNCITNLIKLNAARDMTEYARLHEAAKISLGNIAGSQQNLTNSYAGSRINISGEFALIAGELFASTEARLKSESAANEENAKVARLMKESAASLKDLETYVHNLQITHSSSYAKTVENSARFSARLRDLEELRDQVNDLLAVSTAVYNAQSASSLLIAKGKARSLQRHIAANKNYSFIVTDLKALSDDMNEFLKLRAAAIANKNDEAKKWSLESLKELEENINRINLTLTQEVELASAKRTIESNRQEIIFAQSNSANNILLTNSELVALGLTVTGEINRLFTLNSSAELDKYEAVIRPLFATIFANAALEENALAKLGAKEELAILHNAVASLTAIRSELYSGDGIIATLKRKLGAIEQADQSAAKLHGVVIRQAAKGKESVTAAQVDQEKAIAAVNSMVTQSESRILGIGAMAIIIGAFFGFWIYRSVLMPLRVILDAVRLQRKQGQEKAKLAEAVAGGDLTQEVNISEAITLKQTRLHKDEMGMVLNAIVGMSEAQTMLDRAFAAMTASLRENRQERTRREHIKNGLYELNNILRGEQKTAALAERALAFIASFLGAGVGIIYLYDEKQEMLQTLATYAIAEPGRPDTFRLGEGLAGQVALELKPICLSAVPSGYLRITSALGKADPLNVTIMPIMHNDTLAGVLELGSFKIFSDDDLDFLNQSLEGVAIAINVNRSQQVVCELLEQTQAQTEELRVQQEELQQTNEELMERARMLADQRRAVVEIS
jgi:hypothetical protein